MQAERVEAQCIPSLLRHRPQEGLRGLADLCASMCRQFISSAYIAAVCPLLHFYWKPINSMWPGFRLQRQYGASAIIIDKHKVRSIGIMAFIASCVLGFIMYKNSGHYNYENESQKREVMLSDPLFKSAARGCTCIHN